MKMYKVIGDNGFESDLLEDYDDAWHEFTVQSSCRPKVKFEIVEV